MVLTDDVKQSIGQLLAKAEAGDGLVKAGEQVLELLRGCNVVQRMRLPPKAVGIHPSNRDGLGINALDVHSLINDVLEVGFVPSLVHAVATEIDGREQRQWNEDLVASAGGALGVLEGDSLRAVSLCGGHTNFMLRCFLDGVQHEEGPVTLNGKLSLEALQKTDPCFHQAAVQGVEWDLVPLQVLREWPQLADVIQRAGNAQLNRGEHELQVLRRLHTLYMAASARGPVDFLEVKKKALASKPACASSIPAMYSLALKNSGGAKAAYLGETERFVRANAVSGKPLGDDLWMCLSQDRKSGQQCPRFLHGILKTAYVRRNVQASDVKKAFSNKSIVPKVLEAEQLMNEVRALLKNAGEKWLSDFNCEKALGFFDIALVSYTLNLRYKDDKAYKTMDGAAHDVVQILQGFTQSSMPCRWEADPEEPQKGERKAVPAAAALREFNEDGSLKHAGQLIYELGFEVGQSIRRKDDNMVQGIICDITDTVALSMAGSCTTHVDFKEFMNGEWQKFQVKPQPTHVEQAEAMFPHECLDFQIARVKGLVTAELFSMCQNHANYWSSLRLQLKPTKACTVTAKIPAKKLVLVPASLKVNSKVGQNVAGDAAVVRASEVEGVSFWLAPTTVVAKSDGEGVGAGFVAPYWFVQPAAPEEQPNMELKYVPCSLDSKIQIPVLRNAKELAPGNVLSVAKPEKRAVSPKKTKKEADPKAPAKKSKKAAS
ncbi:unnamed protein product [Effrenium voratum]|nr:unnamed protein product [Effrenium voratum]